MDFLCRFGRVAAGLLLAAGPALAQTTPAPADTARLRYTEEAAPAPADARPVRRADRQQWKLGLNNFRLVGYPFGSSFANGPYYTRYGVHLACERRLGRAWSVQAEVSPALAHWREVGAPTIQAGLELRGLLAGRYYYNLERRLRRGRRTSEFTANYFALSVGSGTRVGALRETPFFLVNTLGAATDVSLLYGLQRRLGHYGFVDANVGLVGLVLSQGLHSVGLNGSLRVGLALPGAAPAPATGPADEVLGLLPKAYVGAQAGSYSYRVHYSTTYPYPPNATTPHGNEQWESYYGDEGVYRNGYGAYTDYMSVLPYVYAGYYLSPRLAVQVGVQYESEEKPSGYVNIFAYNGDGSLRYFYYVSNKTLRRRDLAVPVQVRYALTPVLQKRLQFDVLAGLTPVWSGTRMREYAVTADHQATSEIVYELQRRTFGVHATLGLAAEYGFGRRRRVQAVLEGQLTKDLRTLAAGDSDYQGGGSLGLRYRFGYH